MCSFAAALENPVTYSLVSNNGITASFDLNPSGNIYTVLGAPRLEYVILNMSLPVYAHTEEGSRQGRQEKAPGLVLIGWSNYPQKPHEGMRSMPSVRARMWWMFDCVRGDFWHIWSRDTQTFRSLERRGKVRDGWGTREQGGGGQTDGWIDGELWQEIITKKKEGTKVRAKRRRRMSSEKNVEVERK